MIVGGFGILSMVVAPLFYYQFVIGPSLSKKEFIKPVPVVSAQESSFEESDLDYTKVSTWFPSAIPQPSIKSQIFSYTISIPDLKIKDATVKIGAEDLNRSLIHYGGTGYPGEYGVAVIFGHSILPVFYDPTSYTAIFSTIPTLKNKAKIILNYDGIEYLYEVYDKVVVEANDVSVLEQHFDNSYIYLVSCYPPGTYYKRIVIKAKIVKPN
jgi:sortase A